MYGVKALGAANDSAFTITIDKEGPGPVRQYYHNDRHRDRAAGDDYCYDERACVAEF